MTTDSENFVQEFILKTDEQNNRMFKLCIGLMITIVAVTMVMMIYCGYKEKLIYTNYEYPQITQTNNQTVGGEK